MASIKPLPLIPETKAERYLLLQSSNQHRPSFVFATSAPKKSKVFAFSNTSTRGFSFCSDKRGGLWRIQNVKAARSGYSGDESNNESDDSLQATIEKSKKVLAMQKQLLEQIAERKKMVSSINSSIADPEEDLASYELTGQTEDSVSDSDVASTDGNILVEAKNGSIPPTSNVQQNVDKVPKVQPSAITKDSNVGEKESRMDSPSQKAYAYKDSPKESANTYRKSYMSEVQGIQPSTITKDSSVAKKESRVDSPPQKAYAYKDSAQDSANTYRKSYMYEVPGNQPSARTRDSGVGEKQSRIESSLQKAYAYKDSPQDSADTYRKSYMHEVPGNQPSSISRDSKVGEKQSRITSPPQKADPNKDSPQELTNRYTSRLKHEELVGTQNASVQEIKTDADDPATADSKPPPLAGVNVMNVILVAAECAPWIKTGGLGDVAGALPKALARRGHRVMVVVPRYGDYKEPQDSGVRKMYKVNGQDMEVRYFQAYIDGVDFVFIDSPMFRHLEKNIYAGKREDILKRMVLFCKAAVEVPWHVPCGGVCYGDGNLVFIANDWHTALLPVYLKAYYRDNGLMKYTRSMLVIHNIAHQGRGPVEDFSYVDLPGHYIDLFKLYDPVGGEHFNIFAAGLKTADRVATVSHGYSWELKTSEGGWGLHNIINEIDWKFRGIVNGIDTKEWSPQYDIHLTSDGYTNYSLETLKTGKAQCKAALQKELGLPVRDDIPLIGFIGRLDHQKGVDLIAEAIPWMMGQDVQLVMLGTGRPDLEQMLRNFENQHRDKVRGWVGFSVKTSHRITAGADVLLMPSRFEPCGLNQLYAMSYGTIPVVHAVGGLRDTVQPFDPFNESGLGWTFESAETNRLIHALGNCLVTFREYKKSWEGLQRRGMMQDLSWDNAAQKYEEVLVAAKYQW